MFLKTYRLSPLLISVVTFFSSVTLAGCSSSASADVPLSMLPLDQLSAEVQAAPRAVREAYQFAAANPEILQQIPCYCGCSDIHTSNYACYVSQADSKSVLVFDSHALDCSICVAITRDVMRLLQDGKTLPEIRTYIDATYSEI